MPVRYNYTPPEDPNEIPHATKRKLLTVLSPVFAGVSILAAVYIDEPAAAKGVIKGIVCVRSILCTDETRKKQAPASMPVKRSLNEYTPG